MRRRPTVPATPWVNRDLPRAPLRQSWELRSARVSLLLTTGTAATALDAEQKH
jgi:hypothetical protein